MPRRENKPQASPRQANTRHFQLTVRNLDLSIYHCTINSTLPIAKLPRGINHHTLPRHLHVSPRIFSGLHLLLFHFLFPWCRISRNVARASHVNKCTYTSAPSTTVLVRLDPCLSKQRPYHKDQRMSSSAQSFHVARGSHM